MGSNATGNVSQDCVDRGSIVKKGDLLVQLDPRDAQYALDEGVDGRRATPRAPGTGRSEGISRRRGSRGGSGQAGLGTGGEEPISARRACKQQNAIALSDADQVETDYHSAVAAATTWPMLLAKQLYRSYRQALTHLVTLRKAVEDCSIGRRSTAGWPSGTSPWASG